jgi:hypothetical protein
MLAEQPDEQRTSTEIRELLSIYKYLTPSSHCEWESGRKENSYKLCLIEALSSHPNQVHFEKPKSGGLVCPV